MESFCVFIPPARIVISLFLVLLQSVLNHEWILLLFQGDPCDNVVEDVSITWSFPPPQVSPESRMDPAPISGVILEIMLLKMCHSRGPFHAPG
ncbi:hypothetical protein CDAR_431481 [Caerostris darwini]|uniref:Secreted protein n=1 Tax=Caerostris darwini TaxID=1538125 RepID=A0AAV4W5M9_9ARAC|nr:hypothetical protein CDAR_431481 [Caerostris darwini]